MLLVSRHKNFQGKKLPFSKIEILSSTADQVRVRNIKIDKITAHQKSAKNIQNFQFHTKTSVLQCLKIKINSFSNVLYTART